VSLAVSEPFASNRQVRDEKPDLRERPVDGKRLAQIEALVAAMPEEMRTCFHLRYEQGYAQREIAVLMRLSREIVREHLAAARAWLQRDLAVDLGTDGEE
jgi:RNA polymerase sigma factor (sigma-70 family)